MFDHGFVNRVEWAVAGRAYPGHDASGDRGVVLDAGGGRVLFGVLDGLGHGSGAAEAADRAARVLAENRSEPLDVLLVLCHRAMADTRGAAVSLASFGADETVHWLGVGNVESRVLTAGPAGIAVRATMLLTAGIVGYRLPPTLQPQSIPVRPGDLLLMSTDGILADSDGAIDLARSTADITAAILDSYAKDTDDALVLAARHRGATDPVA
ncbi:SpoIIE family protein phosphatase [Nocardia sp. NPDC050697]|uniref:SpoIIE family protein phosphatase n=1 Tax=Nocardia sp. NPDC050697 TaxID=3155158 RepID=UPI0033E9939E